MCCVYASAAFSQDEHMRKCTNYRMSQFLYTYNAEVPDLPHMKAQGKITLFITSVSGADPGFQKGGGTPKYTGKISELMIFMTHLINVRCNV